MSEEISAIAAPGDARRLDDDLPLVVRARAEDTEAFEALVRKYQGWVFTLTYRMLGDRADAEEVAQEIFLKAYRGLGRFKGDARFSTWLYRIATNHCLNHLESRRRRAGPRSNPGHLVETVSDPAPRPDQVVEQEDARRLVQQALLRLTPEHRSILVLREIQGLSYEEIGELLGLESGTVRSRLHRARMELKERLKPYR
jgi:RNA polymerase sigma-70 factor (ECF subfamily)